MRVMKNKPNWQKPCQRLLLLKRLMLNGVMYVVWKAQNKDSKRLSYSQLDSHNYLMKIDSRGEESYCTVHQEQVNPI